MMHVHCAAGNVYYRIYILFHILYLSHFFFVPDELCSSYLVFFIYSGYLLAFPIFIGRDQ
jgi:hypothetical protein